MKHARLSWKIISAGLVLFLASPHVQASTRVGNGGAGWICREKRDSSIIRWLTVVDLFEARYEFNLKLSGNYESDEWALAASKVAMLQVQVPEFARHLTDLKDIRKALVILPKEVSLEMIDDGAIRVRPAPVTCFGGYLFYFQLANFTHDGRLLVNGEVWNDSAMGAIGRGALLVHEIVYKAIREHAGDRTSVRARAIVGLLFADLPAAERAEQIRKILAADPDYSGPNEDDRF